VKVIKCECGAEFRSDDDDDLVNQAQAHAREVHQLDIPREQVLAMANPA
jgi:predicted small metal-binding protein